MRPPHHSFEEHTGEVAVLLESPTLEGLFVEAASALAELLSGEPPRPSSEPERVELQTSDLEALLVEWVNELIFLSETRKKVYSAFELERLSERELVAQVRGGEPETIKTAVKAATFHRLRIVQGPQGYSATLVLDV